MCVYVWLCWRCQQSNFRNVLIFPQCTYSSFSCCFLVQLSLPLIRKCIYTLMPALIWICVSISKYVFVVCARMRQHEVGAISETDWWTCEPTDGFITYHFRFIPWLTEWSPNRAYITLKCYIYIHTYILYMHVCLCVCPLTPATQCQLLDAIRKTLSLLLLLLTFLLQLFLCRIYAYNLYSQRCHLAVPQRLRLPARSPALGPAFFSPFDFWTVIMSLCLSSTLLSPPTTM